MSDAVNLTGATAANLPSVIEHLADIPEEEIWLAKQKSARTRRAYSSMCSISCGRCISRPTTSFAKWTTAP